MLGYIGNDVEKKIALFEEYAFYIRSLDGRKSNDDKKEAIEEMERLVFQIIKMTTYEYEKSYTLVSKIEVMNIEEELEKLRKLVSLIKTRIKYIEKYLDMYKKVAGLSIERNVVMGEEDLASYQKRVEIIEVYNDNLNKIKSLSIKNAAIDEEVKGLEEKLSGYRMLNSENERRLNDIILSLFSKYHVFDYNPREVMENYVRTKELLELKRGNYELARESKIQKDIKVTHAELTLASEEHREFYVMRNILDLVELQQNEVSLYDEYIEKREKINEVLERINGHPMYDDLHPVTLYQLKDLFGQKDDIERCDDLYREKTDNTLTIQELENDNQNEDIIKILASYKKVEEVINTEEEKKEIPSISSVTNHYDNIDLVDTDTNVSSTYMSDSLPVKEEQAYVYAEPVKDSMIYEAPNYASPVREEEKVDINSSIKPDDGLYKYTDPNAMKHVSALNESIEKPVETELNTWDKKTYTGEHEQPINAKIEESGMEMIFDMENPLKPIQVDPGNKIISKDVASPELQAMLSKNRDKFQDWFYKVSLKLNPLSNMVKPNSMDGDNE